MAVDEIETINPCFRNHFAYFCIYVCLSSFFVS